MISKENLWSIMDCPKFDPWTTRRVQDEQGRETVLDLYRTTIKVKKGCTGEFAMKFFFKKALVETRGSQNPLLLQFYAPAGSLMEAPIISFDIPKEQNHPLFDFVEVLVSLDPDQVLAVFLNIYEVDLFGY